MRIFKKNKKINIQKNSFKNLTSPYIKVRLQLYKEIPALGHDDGSWFIVKNADCTHTGLEERRCTRCQEVLETRTIDAKGHTYEEWIIDKEPSCTDTGSKHKYCSECGDTITEEIPKLEQKKNNTAIVIGSISDGVILLFILKKKH